MATMASTTITISEESRRELLKLAGELQQKQGKKFDYEDVIQFLITTARKSKKDERLLLSAVRPTGRSSAEIRDALRKGRSEGRAHEEELERRYS